MSGGPDLGLREGLSIRRRRLVAALEAPASPVELRDLLGQVDAALARIDAGTFGACEVCHEAIEPDRLRLDPLLRFCLDHLDADGRRALQRDLEMAAEVQRALLPAQDLAGTGWDVRYRFEPFGPVSGDYCDLLVAKRPGAGLLFAVGDVSGKGVAASLLSAHLSALFRTLDPMGLSIAEMLSRANRLFCESTSESRYATLVVGRAWPDGAVEIGNAAQGAPLIVRAGRVESSRRGGLPLGLFCEAPYVPESTRLDPGDMLVLHTDGVTETRNLAGDEFGAERLAAVLGRRRYDSAAAAVSACLDELERFRGGCPPSDDRTLLVLRREG